MCFVDKLSTEIHRNALGECFGGNGRLTIENAATATQTNPPTGVAQQSEQRTLNPWGAGSNPAARTEVIKSRPGRQDDSLRALDMSRETNGTNRINGCPE